LTATINVRLLSSHYSVSRCSRHAGI